MPANASAVTKPGPAEHLRVEIGVVDGVAGQHLHRRRAEVTRGGGGANSGSLNAASPLYELRGVAGGGGGSHVAALGEEVVAEKGEARAVREDDRAEAGVDGDHVRGRARAPALVVWQRLEASPVGERHVPVVEQALAGEESVLSSADLSICSGCRQPTICSVCCENSRDDACRRRKRYAQRGAGAAP